MNAVFADGSVHHINYHIDWTILDQLAGRDDINRPAVSATQGAPPFIPYSEDDPRF